MTGHLARGALVVILAALAAVPPATAAPSVRFTRIQGYAAPGTPARYNRVGILEVGPRRSTDQTCQPFARATMLSARGAK